MIIEAILVDTRQHGRHAARRSGLLTVCSLGAKLSERMNGHFYRVDVDNDLINLNIFKLGITMTSQKSSCSDHTVLNSTGEQMTKSFG